MARKTFHSQDTGITDGILAYKGEDRVIVCDAEVLAGSATEQLFDFFAMAELHGYDVVVQSKNPERDLYGVLARRSREHTRTKVFLENRKTRKPVLLQGGLEINRGKAPYLRITMERNHKLNEWGPLDARLGLNILCWQQGPVPTPEQKAVTEAFREQALARLREHRKTSLATQSLLAEEMAKHGIDYVEFQRRTQERVDIARGLIPPGPKPKPGGPSTPKS